MRFKAKSDYVSLIFREGLPIFFVFLITTDLPFLRTHHQFRFEHNPFHLEYWLLPLMFCYLLFRLFVNYPRYYEFQENGLFVRHGWNKNSIPYDSFDKVLPVSHLYRNISAKRILIITNQGETSVLSLTESNIFIDEKSKRCPQLEPRESEYGLSLQQTVL